MGDPSFAFVPPAGAKYCLSRMPSCPSAAPKRASVGKCACVYKCTKTHRKRSKDGKCAVGSMAQVMHGTARRTAGGLTKESGKIRAIPFKREYKGKMKTYYRYVSAAKSKRAKKNPWIAFLKSEGVYGKKPKGGGKRAFRELPDRNTKEYRDLIARYEAYKARRA